MFGLMRAKTCGLSDAQKLRRRASYCGTCKSLGALYGQKERMLLNHDAVFLAELLTAISGEQIENWDAALHSFNCFRLPDEIPPALEFAAAANVVLFDFKLQDHVFDTGKKRWKLAHKTFSKTFQQAAEKLRGFQFPVDELRSILNQQNARETGFAGETNALDFFSEPTARATALFFGEGSRICGRNDLQNEMSALSFAFGKLIYLLDALEDYEKDFRRGQFNAFRAAFDLSEPKLKGAARRRATAEITQIESEIITRIADLPLSDDDKSLFSNRLHNNIAGKLKINLPVVKIKKCPPRKSLTMAERWQNAVKVAGELSARNWQMPLTFALVAVMAFFAPAQIAKMKSWQECAALSVNLMFLGSLVGAVWATVNHSDINSPIPPGLSPHVRRQQRYSWCDWCDCCDCGCGSCDGCGDACCCDGCGCDCGS